MTTVGRLGDKAGRPAGVHCLISTPGIENEVSIALIDERSDNKRSTSKAHSLEHGIDEGAHQRARRRIERMLRVVFKANGAQGTARDAGGGAMGLHEEAHRVRARAELRHVHDRPGERACEPEGNR